MTDSERGEASHAPRRDGAVDIAASVAGGDADGGAVDADSIDGDAGAGDAGDEPTTEIPGVPTAPARRDRDGRRNPDSRDSRRRGARVHPERDGPIDRSPARLSSAAAVGAALLALVSSGSASILALLLGALGVALTLGGLLVARRGPITVGATLLFVGTLVAGVAGAGVLPLLVSVAASVLTWDLGRNAVDVGAQLGRRADTTGIELVHAGASVLIVSLSAGLGYAVFDAAAGGQPVVALVALLLSGVLLSLALS